MKLEKKIYNGKNDWLRALPLSLSTMLVVIPTKGINIVYTLFSKKGLIWYEFTCAGYKDWLYPQRKAQWLQR